MKPYRCRNSPKSFKSSNGFKYHLHSNEANRMEMGNTGELEGKLRIICAQFPFHQKINKPLLGWSNFRCVF